MATILGANTLSSGFNVANSVRFNDNDSPSMYKTPGSGGDQRTWTFSTWFKRGNLGSSQWILDAYDVANSCRFNSADSASLKDGDGSAPAGNRQKFTF